MLLLSLPTLLTYLPIGHTCITLYLNTYLYTYIVVYVKSSCSHNEGILGGFGTDQSGGMPSFILNLGIWYANDQFDVLANLLTRKKSLLTF
jgi:hypothetical protein